MPTDTRPWNCDGCKWCVARGCNEHENKTGPYKPPPRLPTDRPASEPFPVTQRERDIVERNHRDTRPDPLREALEREERGWLDSTPPAGHPLIHGIFQRLPGTLASLASGAVTEGLDVRRVKQAVVNVAKRHGVEPDPPPTVEQMTVARIFGYSTAPAVMDAEIAAEYARLSGATDRPGQRLIDRLEATGHLAPEERADLEWLRDRAALSEPET